MTGTLNDTLVAVIGFGYIFLILFQYVYYGLVFMTIARKLKCEKHWLVWIPVARFFIIPILARWHWAWGFLAWLPLANIVLRLTWMWQIFERRKYPGWLVLVPLGVPVAVFAVLMPIWIASGLVESWLVVAISAAVLAGTISWAIVFGLVAWKDRR